MPLIDRDALKKQMCKICNENHSDDPCEPNDCVFLNAVDNAPTIDAVPVVRCKDCTDRYLEMGTGPWCCLRDGHVAPDDFFCACGERRSE